MSPTSYQAAPPRKIILTAGSGRVKQTTQARRWPVAPQELVSEPVAFVCGSVAHQEKTAPGVIFHPHGQVGAVDLRVNRNPEFHRAWRKLQRPRRNRPARFR